MYLILDYDTIMAAGRDAGDQHMRKHGRSRWNEEDQAAAAAATNELFKEASQCANHSR